MSDDNKLSDKEFEKIGEIVKPKPDNLSFEKSIITDIDLNTIRGGSLNEMKKKTIPSKFKPPNPYRKEKGYRKYSSNSCNIGFVGFRQQHKYFGIPFAYMSLINEFGTVKILSPGDFDPDLDLLIVPGGPDVDPSRYNQIPGLFTSAPCIMREYFDKNILPKYIHETNVPIFGICRGHQSIAVHHGAHLIQDMYHETNDSNDRTEKVHNVFSKFSEKGDNFFGVNSIHHQIVNSKTIKPGMNVDCVYSGSNSKFKESDVDDSQIESILYSNQRIATVQWHPEECRDRYSIELIKKLINGENIIDPNKIS